ncbi:MAG: metallopeptidase family protein [Clostridiales bacterium]|jgi:hypothetical protein|nr:metallopeptidase family protein [Clostridiales bacterium]
MMVTFEEAGEMLDEIAESLPEEIFNRLNGGIVFLPETKRNPMDPAGQLFILGEYQVNSLGRTIVLFFGSFGAAYGDIGKEQLREKLRDTLHHEFTHHLESLAGERDLEVADARYLHSYFSRMKKQKP